MHALRRPIVATLFYLLLVAFLVRFLSGADWSRLAELRLQPLYVLLAVPFSLIPRLLQPAAWSRLIRGHGAVPPPYPQVTRVYATSWMGRYIPGKIAWIGAKVLFGSRYGLQPSLLAATAVVEALIQLAVALGLSFLLFAVAPESAPLPPAVRTLSVIAFATMAALLVPTVFNALARRAAAMLKQPAGASGRLSVRTLVSVVLLYVGIHALSGLPVYLLLAAIHPALSPAQIPFLTAAFLVAGTIGTLALFAPSGLGVREGVLIVLLAIVLPKSVAALAVVFLRLWSMGMDLLFYGLAIALDRLRPFEPA